MTLPLPLLLALLSAIAPLAIDMYLPAMAQMAGSLDSDIHHVELSVSTFLLGFAIGQITGGPLSDRYGRKPIIITGLTIFAIASLTLSMTTSLSGLLILRAIEAIGGGLATVNSTAIVRDRFEGKDIAKVLSMVAMIMMTAPLVAPMLGSLIVSFSNWRSIFMLLSVYSAFVMILLVWLLPESHPPHRRSRAKPWVGYGVVLRHKVARRFILTLACAYSGMFIFITASPYLYLDYFEQSAAQFPWLFGANVVVIMMVNRINMLLLNRFKPIDLITTGISIQVVMGCILLTLSRYFPDAFTLWTVLPLMMAYVGALGLISANSMATVLQYFRDVAGSATALIGVVQFCGGAAFGLLWGQLHDNTPVPMMAMMFLSAFCAFVALMAARYSREIYEAPAT
ncbi:MAG: multidrug effflux MFS transporter [Thalassolituus oleivorans]|jgi:DHA1 family bicyclomycin/chloramphenicol resistance-like MFS transporter|uniref:multidrug effflux MFS transporter n=1 Tax=Thalassolituus oleivorans TaxID=187493 RepID=UPI001B3CDA46|nr:multidrug effflux MFS transporter [Thalassolituus oleivorans]MBQ0726435.1 multidrug effflux MFS transporter [Thalassolituus oleivorans]MBQ0781025.1 multidrug effflux MFS transporter [Thalassolituus oleivorans]